MRLDADDLLNLVDVIHAGGSCDDARRRSVHALSDAFGQSAVMLFRQAGGAVEDLEHARWPEASLELCTGPLSDPRANGMLEMVPHMPLGAPTRPNASGDGYFEQSGVFATGMQPFGLRHPLGALVARTERDFSSVSIMGWAHAEPFTTEHERLLARLMPALTSADRTRRLLIEALQARLVLEEALDRVGRAVAVVDEERRLRYANAPALSAMDAGEVIRVGGGRLDVADRGAQERFRASVIQAVAHGGQATLVPTTTGMLRVEPLKPGELGISRPLAMIVRSESTYVSPEHLRRLYGLTAREAEVAMLFVRGCGINEAAAELDRSRNTIKTEARAIYSKLGVNGYAKVGLKILSDLAHC